MRGELHVSEVRATDPHTTVKVGADLSFAVAFVAPDKIFAAILFRTEGCFPYVRARFGHG